MENDFYLFITFYGKTIRYDNISEGCSLEYLMYIVLSRIFLLFESKDGFEFVFVKTDVAGKSETLWSRLGEREMFLYDYNIKKGDTLTLIYFPTAGDGGPSFDYLINKYESHSQSLHDSESGSIDTCETHSCGSSSNNYESVQSFRRKRNDDSATTAADPFTHKEKTLTSYQPQYESKPLTKSGSRGAFWSMFFSRKKKMIAKYEVYGSVFAPAEVRPKSHMLVQVYLHLFEEIKKVQSLAQESDKDAERRNYIPVQCNLKKGDRVDVWLNIYGETPLMSDKKSVVWQGSITKCSFDYFVPKDIDVYELSCVVLLSVNGVPVGEMQFITQIVDSPRQLNTEIIARKYNKVFISYSHRDEAKVKFLHEGLELGSVPHFFDRKYLKAGDVFPQVIKDYINSADLFVLCWSENASTSEYVQKERLQALERAFPQVKPEHEAKLRIYPISIEPRAELPTDMKDHYHFGEI